MSLFDPLKKDKLLHFICGSFIFMIWHIIFKSIPIALIALIIGAVGKEVFDYFSIGHTADVWDVVYTIFGGLQVLIYYLLI